MTSSKKIIMETARGTKAFLSFFFRHLFNPDPSLSQSIHTEGIQPDFFGLL